MNVRKLFAAGIVAVAAAGGATSASALVLSATPNPYDVYTTQLNPTVWVITVYFAGTATNLSVSTSAAGAYSFGAGTCTGTRTNSCTFQVTSGPGRQENFVVTAVVTADGAEPLTVTMSRNWVNTCGGQYGCW